MYYVCRPMYVFVYVMYYVQCRYVCMCVCRPMYVRTYVCMYVAYVCTYVRMYV